MALLGHRLDWRALILVGVAAVVIYLTLVPILMVIYGSFRDGPPGAHASFTLQNYIQAFSNPRLYRAFLNSLVFALGGGSVAFAIGAFLAWLTERTNTPGKALVYA